MEILGCGVVQPVILSNNGISKKAIAAGFGLDRLTMIFAGITDIRYLWATNSRFLDQYKDGKLNKFQPYSELTSQKRDISFYIPFNKLDTDKKWLYENDFFELIRNHAGDSVESVKLVDSFHNNKRDKHSRTYAIVYSPTDPNMNNPAEFKKVVNELQDKLRELVLTLEIELR
jgi:phenylalanyl-tRNA synthetase alpha chain